MNITTEKRDKARYTTPAIERTELDNEISLVLASQDPPPYGPNEAYLDTKTDYFNNGMIT